MCHAMFSVKGCSALGCGRAKLRPALKKGVSEGFKKGWGWAGPPACAADPVVRYTLHRTCEKATGSKRPATGGAGRRVSVMIRFTASSSRTATSLCTL